MTSVDSNLASVRKYCACWDTGPDPGYFYRSPLAGTLSPAPGYDCALEVVMLLTATTTNIIVFDDSPHSQNRLRIYTGGGVILGGLATSGSGGEKTVSSGAVIVGNWYHVLVHWQELAGTARIELFVDGVSKGTTAYYARLVWVLGANSYMQLGGPGGFPSLGTRIALGRYYKDDPPAASYLYNVPYLTQSVVPHLKCQWDMRPGYGNTLIDSEGRFSIPWLAIDQPNVIYSSYRYTGQCRGDLWTPP